jgi:hypothetical protein
MLEATREADDADGVAEAETVVATVWFEFRSEVFIDHDEKVQERQSYSGVQKEGVQGA